MQRIVMLAVFSAVLFAYTGTLTLNASDSKRDLYRRNRIRDNACQNNLQTFYSMLKFYADQHKNQLPAGNNLEGLRALFEYSPALKIFSCDAARAKKAKRPKDLDEKSLAYIYFGGVNLANALRICPKLVLMCDKPDSRHLNVLLADGSIVELQPRKLNRKISNCQDIVETLNHLYSYPTDVLKNLRVKAKAIDSKLAGKK